MREIKEAIVHCSATRAEWWQDQPTSKKVEEIRRWHVQDRGWRDIGYHFLIDRDGTIAKGRPIEQTGAHVKGHNTGTVGICLLGGHGSSENDAFRDHFTGEQDAALRAVLDDLTRRYGFSKITGHNQYAAKACPGFNVPRWLANKTPTRESVASSTTVQATGAGAAATATAGGAAIGALDGTAQIVAIVAVAVVLLAFAWIARERIKKWAAGVK